MLPAAPAIHHRSPPRQAAAGRGYLLRKNYKGFPALHGSPRKEDWPLYSIEPGRIKWWSRLHRKLVVIGIVDELPPFMKEMRKSETAFQGFPQGVYFIRVETIEDASPK
jgi:hypothetical protein